MQLTSYTYKDFNDFCKSQLTKNKKYNLIKIVRCPWNERFEGKYYFFYKVTKHSLDFNQTRFLLDSQTLEQEYIREHVNLFQTDMETFDDDKKWQNYSDVNLRRELTFELIDKEGDIGFSLLKKAIIKKLNENKKTIQ